MLLVAIFCTFMAAAFLFSILAAASDADGWSESWGAFPDWINQPGEDMRAAREVLEDPAEVLTFPRKF